MLSIFSKNDSAKNKMAEEKKSQEELLGKFEKAIQEVKKFLTEKVFSLNPSSLYISNKVDTRSTLVFTSQSYEKMRKLHKNVMKYHDQIQAKIDEQQLDPGLQTRFKGALAQIFIDPHRNSRKDLSITADDAIKKYLPKVIALKKLDQIIHDMKEHGKSLEWNYRHATQEAAVKGESGREHKTKIIPISQEIMDRILGLREDFIAGSADYDKKVEDLKNYINDGSVHAIITHQRGLRMNPGELTNRTDKIIARNLFGLQEQYPQTKLLADAALRELQNMKTTLDEVNELVEDTSPEEETYPSNRSLK